MRLLFKFFILLWFIAFIAIVSITATRTYRQFDGVYEAVLAEFPTATAIEAYPIKKIGDETLFLVKFESQSQPDRQRAAYVIIAPGGLKHIELIQ